MKLPCKRHRVVSDISAGGTGHDQLHNYAFLGPSGRIGTASDVVYAFVPAGPKKQLDMFFHGIECRQKGLGEVVYASVSCSLECL